MVEDKKDKHPYQDIMNLKHPVSTNHEHMSVHDRAAQFSPFAALTGFEGAIKETARLTDHKMELDETAKIILDEKLRILQEHLSKQQEIEFEYFRSDELKAGGSYVTVRGAVKKIDTHQREVVMINGIRIPIEEIVDIRSDIFQVMDDFMK
jgi:TPP-dependent indolepyruvate ferredoxin oxidoreductase alpha subunit